ncbi:hypothetical protein HMSSN036_84060 [Paenibacillus macerans]|nr:hypothetical protein HMSSN036_84060 [Paenibacillus macerans]
MSLNNRIVIVTGASSGIGALSAQMLSERGAVVVLAARSPDKLKQVGSRMKGPYRLLEMDVGDDASTRSGFERVFSEYGRVDVLVNNAGYGKFEYFDQMPLPEFAEMMNVNYIGMVRCAKAVLPYMNRRAPARS